MKFKTLIKSVSLSFLIVSIPLIVEYNCNASIETFNNYVIEDGPLMDDEFNNESLNTILELQDMVKESINNIDYLDYSKDDLYLLAGLINAEASDACTDEHKMWVGQVVLNRVKREDFPNTIREVIYQKGQYQCVNNGAINEEISERSLNVAKWLLSKDRDFCDNNVIFQSEFPQGNEIVKIIYNEHLGSTTYFCK